jgi:hypothetical protein
MTLPNKKRLVSIRAKVPINTLVAAPVSVKVQLQNPIIEKMYFFALGATIHESGFRVLINGIQAIPAMESEATPDMSNVSNFVPLGGSTQEIKLDYQVPGSPYNVEVQFYNLSAVTQYFAAVEFLTAPKIDLPKMPIEDDKVSKKPEYDS